MRKGDLREAGCRGGEEKAPRLYHSCDAYMLSARCPIPPGLPGSHRGSRSAPPLTGACGSGR